VDRLERADFFATAEAVRHLQETVNQLYFSHSVGSARSGCSKIGTPTKIEGQILATRIVTCMYVKERKTDRGGSLKAFKGLLQLSTNSSSDFSLSQAPMISATSTQILPAPLFSWKALSRSALFPSTLLCRIIALGVTSTLPTSL